MSAPSPERIFELFNAYQITEAVRAAIDLNVFGLIAQGKTTVEDLAAAAGAQPRGIRILGDFLTVHGVLTKTGSNYGLAPDSATFLVPESPAYMGGMVRFLHHDAFTANFRHIARTIRTGKLPKPGGTVEPEFDAWVDFAKAMVPMMMPAAQQIAGLLGPLGAGSVLDIAAGHGMFGITIALRNPEAKIKALDWGKVLDVAAANAAAAGVAAQFERIDGDAFSVPFGGPYDVVLLTNFLHHFDFAQNVELLKKVRAALKPGGRAVTLEAVPNDDRLSPHMPATFALIMLAGTPGGDSYTFKELEAMFREAGFSSSTQHALEMSPETVILSHA